MSDDEAAYLEIPGGRQLVAWFGRVPSFHDAEIVSLNLRRKATSSLTIHAWNMTDGVDDRGYRVLDRHAIVTFVMEDVVDLELDGFSHQNVISGLRLKRTPDRPDRRAVYTPSPNDYEIELEPCFGLDGFIRCRRVSVEFTPGKPNDA